MPEDRMLIYHPADPDMSAMVPSAEVEAIELGDPQRRKKIGDLVTQYARERIDMPGFDVYDGGVLQPKHAPRAVEESEEPPAPRKMEDRETREEDEPETLVRASALAPSPVRFSEPEPEPEPQPRKDKKVLVKGSFGKMVLYYTEVIKTSTLLVCVSDLAEVRDRYSPPEVPLSGMARSEPLTLYVEDWASAFRAVHLEGFEFSDENTGQGYIMYLILEEPGKETDTLQEAV